MWEGRCSPSGDGKTEARNGGSTGPHLMVLGKGSSPREMVSRWRRKWWHTGTAGTGAEGTAQAGNQVRGRRMVA